MKECWIRVTGHGIDDIYRAVRDGKYVNVESFVGPDGFYRVEGSILGTFRIFRRVRIDRGSIFPEKQFTIRGSK